MDGIITDHPDQLRAILREDEFGPLVRLATRADMTLTRHDRARADYASFLAGMRLSTALWIGVLAAAVGLCWQGQKPAFEGKGLPPRATPADYQVHAQAGTVTVAADFMGHAVPTLEGNLATEEYVMIEAGVFGPADTRLKLAIDDFSLRINGKKAPLPSQPYGLVVKSVKDPEWEPPETPEQRKERLTKDTSAKVDKSGEPKASPTPVKVPLEIQRGWAQRVQRSSFPEGDRALPQAGVLFFEYRGKPEKIRSMELIYAGPAGKATLPLQP